MSQHAQKRQVILISQIMATITRKRKRNPNSQSSRIQDGFNRGDYQKTLALLTKLDFLGVEDLLFDLNSEFIQIDLFDAILRALFNRIQAWRFGFTLDLIQEYIDNIYSTFIFDRLKSKMPTKLFVHTLFTTKINGTLSNPFDCLKFRHFLHSLRTELPHSIYEMLPEIPIPQECSISFEKITYVMKGFRKEIQFFEERMKKKKHDWILEVESIRQTWLIWFQDSYSVYRNPLKNSSNPEISSLITWLPEELMLTIVDFIYKDFWRLDLKIAF